MLFKCINKIESNEFKIFINDIKLDISITKIKNKDIKISVESKKSEKSMKLNSNIIMPEESMEDYIEKIIRFKKRIKVLNCKSDIENKQDKQITNLNISVKDIELEPIESILYFNDIYNVIIKEEIYNNSIINSKKQNLISNRTSRTMSISSKNSENSNKNMNNDSILDPNQSQNSNIDISPFEKKEPSFILNFNLSSIKCIINDQFNHRETDIIIKDINLKNGNLLCKNIEFLILYEVKDFRDKVRVNLGQINNINLSIEEKINCKTSYTIIIDEILFTICKDSFSYLENLLDSSSDIISNCFVQPKKSNKIVMKKKTDKVISTYDLDDKYDEQESEIFGNNIAKSICLISTKNELLLDIEEDYLDNLKNEKEEFNEIIEVIDQSTLREKREQNQNESNLKFTIKKINIGLYGGNDFKTTIEIKTQSVFCVNNEKERKIEEKEKKEEKEKIEEDEGKEENIDDINNDNNDFIEKFKILENNLGNVNNNEEESKEEKDNININEEIKKNEKDIKQIESDSFEMVEFNPQKKINSRELNNYLMISMENLNLFILYEKQNSYEIEFSINDFEIKDNLQESTFKRLLSARKNVELNEEKKNTQFLSVFVDISNSQNELSQNNYKDFNIACEISLTPIQLMVHQQSLLFALRFFIKNEERKKNNNTKENNNIISLKLYNIDQFHTDPSYVLNAGFSEVIIEDYGEEQNDLIEDKKFIYITYFIFKEFKAYITYESNDLGFSFQNIYLPIIPDLKGYEFIFNEIRYKGFVTINKFAEFFISSFFDQISKYNVIFDLLKSLSWTQPIVNIFGDFFDIFISPFKSYRRNQGFMQGLFKGLKKFFFNLLSKNVYVGEKFIRTLTTFIGVTKNNYIGKNSFYEKYILTDEKKKIYDYFYK